MFRSIHKSKRQLPMWKNSMLLLLQTEKVKLGLTGRSWFYPKTRCQDSYLPRSSAERDRSIIVALNICLPFAIMAFMVLYTLEETLKTEILDYFGVWLVVSEITGEHRPLGGDQPRKEGSPAHPVIESDEIRLLVLESGRGDAPLECRLIRNKVSNEMWYEALSYAWGITPNRHTMKCNGEMVSITENLESALRHLRHPVARRVLTSDAEERGHQVQLMSPIFSQARRVIVWLGEETPDVKDALSVRPSRGHLTSTLPMDNAAVSLSNGDLWPLIRLLERPWFRRLWVLQEAALAKTVILHCGKKRVRWEEFPDTLNQLKRKGLVFDSFTPEAAMGVETVLEIEKVRSGGKQSLLSVLLDKVYGVLSLARDYIPRRGDLADEASVAVLGPDYTIRTSEAFLRLAIWGIQVYGAPDVLSCTSRTDVEPLSELQGLPSWVPDWTRIDNNMPFARYKFCHISQHEAPFVCDEPVIIHGLNLEIPALYIDRVAHVGCKSQCKKTPLGKLWEEEDEGPSKVMLRIHKWSDETARAMGSALAWIYDCERLASLACGEQMSPSDSSRQIWRTLTAGMNGKGQTTSEDFGHHFQMYRDFLEACIRVHNLGGSDMMVPRSQIDTVGQVEEALHMWSWKRRFATTKNGFTVLVPNQTLEGDIIVLAANSKVPHVLRPRSDGSYTVLGEAYLGNTYDRGPLGKKNHIIGSFEKAKYFRLA
ncbi:heterokaryon incompatibility protein-domain-containing protein [Nemania diffusa]|nr:heterokaryon incompatibility protein-domain-containing protein [Nemania diffusa]